MLRNVLALLLTFVLGACASNHDFRRTNTPAGEPDLVALKAANHSREGGEVSQHDLVSIHWFPLIHLGADGFKQESNEGFPSGGHSRGHLNAWGPLFFFLEGESWHWNTADELYEREETFSLLWGCFRKRELLVNTKLGWRRETTTRWLWLLGDDEIEYTPEPAQP